MFLKAGTTEEGEHPVHPGLLDMSGGPLLYSPAFYRFYLYFMSQRLQAEFTCGG